MKKEDMADVSDGKRKICIYEVTKLLALLLKLTKQP